MLTIDQKRVIGDTTNMLLSNISEQLQELITLLKPHEVKEVREQPKEIKPEAIKCPKCGITKLKGKPLTKQTLSAHARFCKGGV